MRIEILNHYGFAGNVEGCKVGLIIRGIVYGVDCEVISFFPHVNLHYFTFLFWFTHLFYYFEFRTEGVAYPNCYAAGNLSIFW